MAPLTVTTDYRYHIQFFPNSSGLFQFKVCAGSHVYVVLSGRPDSKRPNYFVNIWKSRATITAFRIGGTQSDAEVIMSNLLSLSQYRGFWIRYNDLTISAGREGESTPFIHYTDSEELPINFVGINTGGEMGNWIIEYPPSTSPEQLTFTEPIELTTGNEATRLFPSDYSSSGLFHFKVRARAHASVFLGPTADQEPPFYRIHLGSANNIYAQFQKNRNFNFTLNIRGLLSAKEFRGFWIRWNNLTISVGQEGESTPFILYTDTEKVPINFVGIGTGPATNNNWIIEKPHELQTSPAPIEQLKPTAPIEQLKPTPPIEQPKPTTPIEQPKSTTPIEQPKPTTPIEQPKSTTPIEQPKSKTPIDQPTSTPPIQVSTDNKLVYQFFLNSSGLFQFKVRAPHDAHLALTTTAAETNPMYEVLLGSWGNTLSVIRKNQDNPNGDVAKVSTPGILSEEDFKGFWIRWNNGMISVGKQDEKLPFIHYADSEKIEINFVGICTGWGATGSWVIEQPIRMQKPIWIPAEEGQVPCNAFKAGEENGERMFVIRAYHENNLVPGKLLSSRRTSLVGWDGKENAHPQYEVLCNFNGTWKQCKGNAIPDNAVVAGQTKGGESLYVGRALHKGSMTVGKVHPSSGVCYIPYDGKEVAYEQYEILVS